MVAIQKVEKLREIFDALKIVRKKYPCPLYLKISPDLEKNDIRCIFYCLCGFQCCAGIKLLKSELFRITTPPLLQADLGPIFDMHAKGPHFAWRPQAENLENVKGPPFTRRPQAENLGIFGAEGTENFIFERFSTHKICVFLFLEH